MRVLLLALTLALAATPATAQPRFGMWPFPYDLTPQAQTTVNWLSTVYGNLWVIHENDGIPWAEALADAPFPASQVARWDALAAAVPPGRPVYLALGPVGLDRATLVPAWPGSSTPPAIAGQFDAPATKAAYLTYARRAVQRFRPAYLNLGIEAGDVASNNPAAWPAFAALYEHVRAALKAEYPQLQIGISFSVPALVAGTTAWDVWLTVATSDYLGLSFYPYFYSAFAGSPPPPAQWRNALAFVKSYADALGVGLAMTETGYITRPITVSGFSFTGTETLQRQYLTELVSTARSHGYRFVVWAIPVDFDALAAHLPPGDPGRLWMSAGFYRPNGTAKPAWAVWQQAVQPVVRRAW